MQQKIVEAAIKLSNEEDLCKTVKKKRRNNYLDAMRKLEDIEKEINAYRIKKGKKPTQRTSLILAGTQKTHRNIMQCFTRILEHETENHSAEILSENAVLEVSLRIIFSSSVIR